MFCRVCGNELPEKAVVCAHCGSPIEEGGTVPAPGEPWKWWVMVGLLLLTMIPGLGPVGIVFGIIGLRDPNRKVQGAVLLTSGIFMTVLLILIILGV